MLSPQSLINTPPTAPPPAPFPFVSEELLRELRKKFPNKLPNRGVTEREVWLAVGANEVLEFMEFMREQQHEIGILPA